MTCYLLPRSYSVAKMIRHEQNFVPEKEVEPSPEPRNPFGKKMFFEQLFQNKVSKYKQCIVQISLFKNVTSTTN